MFFLPGVVTIPFFLNSQEGADLQKKVYLNITFALPFETVNMSFIENEDKQYWNEVNEVKA